MKVTGVIQARLGSERLPGKVLAELAGDTVLGVMLQRLGRSRKLDDLVVAIPESDDAIAGEAGRHGIAVFRGDELDVLRRIYEAAAQRAPDYVVRFTADCPLVDPEFVDEMIQRAVETDADYVGYQLRPTFPDGMGAEVIRFAALERAHREATEREDREHVTWYVRTRPDEFRQVLLDAERDLGAYRFTVDTARDLEVVRTICSRFPDLDFSWREVVDLIDRDPDLRARAITQVRNEKGPLPIYFDKDLPTES